ncbi:MAG: RNA polymerase sigma factor [Chthonomonadales bacterium]
MVSSFAQQGWAQEDAEIVRRVRRGDTQAFDALFHRYYNPIYGFAFHLLGDGTAAEDVAQEAFVRAFAGIAGLRDADAFLEWMYRITLNLVRDRARNNRRKPWISFFDLRKSRSREEAEPVDFADAALDPARIAQSDARAGALYAAIAALPQEFREVVVLHHLQKVGVQGIARLLGVPEGTVKSRLGRARAKLRSALADWIEGVDDDAQRSST